MRKLTLILALGLVLGLAVPSATSAHTALAAPSPAPAYTGTCSPPGPDLGGVYYQWIANGGPVDTSCWNSDLFHTAVTQSTPCGWWVTEKAWEFYYAGSISQSITIPSTYTATHYGIQYELDFEHPNAQAWWDQISMIVYDQTAGTELAGEYINGYTPSFSCSQRYFPWTANLAGHTLTISFSGQGVSSNAHVRIRHIALFSH